MVGVICQYQYWRIRNYLPVPVLANKKLFASTSWLCITQGAEGIKRRNEKAVLAVGKGLVRIYRREGYLQIPTSIFLQVLYFQLRNYMQVLLCYNSRQIKLLTLSKTDQLEAGDYKVHICGSEGGGILVKSPSSTQYNHNCRWGLHENYFAPIPLWPPRNTDLGRW